MEETIIKELVTEKDFLAGYPIMKQLRSHLNEDAYMELVLEAKEKEQYRQFALFDGDEVVAVIGFQPMITLYYGRYIWVCDLVTDAAKRSKGYGEKLLGFVHDLARSEGYSSVALSSGLHRAEAHRFYEWKMGYDRVSYVFKTGL